MHWLYSPVSSGYAPNPLLLLLLLVKTLGINLRISNGSKSESFKISPFVLFCLRFNKDPNRGSYSDLVYIKPYCRIAPYLVGIALGYLIHVEKVAPSKSPLVSTSRRVEKTLTGSPPVRAVMSKLGRKDSRLIGWKCRSLIGHCKLHSFMGMI